MGGRETASFRCSQWSLKNYSRRCINDCGTVLFAQVGHTKSELILSISQSRLGPCLYSVGELRERTVKICGFLYTANVSENPRDGNFLVIRSECWVMEGR